MNNDLEFSLLFLNEFLLEPIRSEMINILVCISFSDLKHIDDIKINVFLIFKLMYEKCHIKNS